MKIFINIIAFVVIFLSLLIVFLVLGWVLETTRNFGVVDHMTEWQMVNESKEIGLNRPFIESVLMTAFYVMLISLLAASIFATKYFLSRKIKKCFYTYIIYAIVIFFAIFAYQQAEYAEMLCAGRDIEDVCI